MVHFLPKLDQTRVHYFQFSFFLARFARILTVSVALNLLIMHQKHKQSLRVRGKGKGRAINTDFGMGGYQSPHRGGQGSHGGDWRVMCDKIKRDPKK